MWKRQANFLILLCGASLKAIDSVTHFIKKRVSLGGYILNSSVLCDRIETFKRV